MQWGGNQAKINIEKIAEKTGADAGFTLSVSVSKGTYLLIGTSVGRASENNPGDFTSTGDAISCISLSDGGSVRTYVFIQETAKDQEISITKATGAGYVQAKAEIYKIM